MQDSVGGYLFRPSGVNVAAGRRHTAGTGRFFHFVNPNMSRTDSTLSNTFHVNPHVAERLYDRYTSALSQVPNAATKDSSSSLPSPITSLQLQTLIEVSFWASLIQEEGQYHDFSLTLCPQEFAADSFVFESRVHFKPRSWRNLPRH